MADKSAQNLMHAIDASKGRGLARLLFALGIPHVGSHVADVLARNFSALDALTRATEDELQEVPEIGPKVASSVAWFFSKEHTRRVLRKLIEAGVNTGSLQEVRENPGFAGKTFVVTGTLGGYSRGEIEDLIESLGGRAASSVSRKTDYLIVGANPGGKLDRARELGVAVLSEEDFERLRTGEAGGG